MDENKSEVNSLNKTEIFRYAIVFFFAVDVVPAVVGIPLMVAFQTSIYMEVFYIVFGVIALLAVLFRSRRRDSKNYKNNKTIFEDKTTPEYRSYRIIQWLMIASGVLALGLSLASYFIGRAVFPA